MESMARRAKWPSSKWKLWGLLGALILSIALVSLSIPIYVGWNLIHPKNKIPALV